MKPDPHITPVVFRRYPAGDILALFPTLPGTRDPATCESYQHIGQHGHADYAGCMRTTWAAFPKEYQSLMLELMSLGYNLRVLKRAPSNAINERIKNGIR